MQAADKYQPQTSADVIAGISNNWRALKFVKYERGTNVWGFPWFKIRVSRKNNKRGRSDDWFVVCYISHKEREEKVKRCFCCSLMPSCCPCEELAASFASVSPGLIWEASPLCYEIKGWDGSEIKTAADQIYSRNVKQTWSKTVRWSSESRSGFISLTSLRRHTKMIRCCFGLNMCDASVQSAKAEVMWPCWAPLHLFLFAWASPYWHLTQPQRKQTKLIWDRTSQRPNNRSPDSCATHSNKVLSSLMSLL